MTAQSERIWVLMGQRPGDNLQCRELANLTGAPYLEKHLVWRPTGGPVSPRQSEKEIDLEASGLLNPPWPAMIISAGRACGRVARLLGNRISPRPKLVHVGNPRRYLQAFDLVISAPQYGVPIRPNVFLLDLPLIITPDWETADIARWQDKLAGLPRPWLTLLIGGPSRRYMLNEAAIADFTEAMERIAGRLGGSLLITTSRRTSPIFLRALEGLKTPKYLHQWTQQAHLNPYWAFIALADAVVVTGDSASMMVEATLSGAPTFVYTPPPLRTVEFALRTGFFDWMQQRVPPDKYNRGDWQPPLLARLQDLLNRRRVLRYDRNMERLHRALYSRGLATPFADLATSSIALKRDLPKGAIPHPSDLPGLIRRLQALAPEAFSTPAEHDVPKM